MYFRQGCILTLGQAVANLRKFLINYKQTTLEMKENIDEVTNFVHCVR